MELYANKRITVAGLGSHGGAIGNIRWLHEQGARLTVTDLQPAEQLQKARDALADLENIVWVLGEHRMRDFTDANMVLRNPAVPATSEYLQAAQSAHVPIEMDSSLFFSHCPSKHIIGVTGTKGKTTTTHAIACLLGLRYPRVHKIGVEGTSPLATLSDIRPEDMVVFELSSWRLEALEKHRASPHIAVMTSLYRDHLNTYSSYDAYHDTKKTIARYQQRSDTLLVNYDDEQVRTWLDNPAFPARGASYSIDGHIPGDGIYNDNDVITCRQAHQSASLFPISELPAIGRHGRRNLLPAIYLAWVNQVRVADMVPALQHMPAVPHRMEIVTTHNDVTFINDSAATIPDATIAAISSLKPKHFVLIAGGNDKELEFEELALHIAANSIRAIVYLPGNATADIQRLVDAAFTQSLPQTEAETMTEAVTAAWQMAEPGDTILLSPGATSFGSFKNEFDRGNQFVAAVNALVSS